MLRLRNPLYRPTYVPSTEPPVNELPVVNLTAPTDGLVYESVPATVNLEATASDPDGAIHRLEFLRDNLIVKSFSHYNVASAFMGGVATASSTLNYPGIGDFLPAGAIDGEINGINWQQGKGWAGDAAAPQWIQIDFASVRTINQIDVTGYPNNIGGNITTATLATAHGIVDFLVQWWNGSSWVTVATVTGNTLAFRQFNFQAVATSRIRIYVTAEADGLVRLIEVRAWATDVTAPSPAIFTSTDTSVPIGTYAYTAKAYDAVDAVTTSSAASVTVQTPPPVITPGGGNFAYRRSLPGTVRWLKPDSAGFDNGHGMNLTGTTGDNVGIVQGVYTNPVLDTAVKASGLSSLRIDKPNTHPDEANVGGDWFCNFSVDEQTTFTEGQEFFVQFRYRMNSIMYDTVFAYGPGFQHDGFKIAMVGAGDSPGLVPGSSSASKLVMASHHQQRFPFFYHYGPGGETALIEYGLPGGDYDRQPGGPDPACAAYLALAANPMSTAIPPGCIGFYPNEWMTFQIGVSIGQFNGVNQWANTRLRLWVARENQPSVLAIDWVGSHVSGDGQFGKLWVSNYTSLNDGAQLEPFPDGGSVWYDEFIISTIKIPDPLPDPVYPTYRQGMIVGQFNDIQNTVWQQTPGAAGNAWQNWNSFALDYVNNDWYSAAAGGHGSNNINSPESKNGVYRIRLMDNAPAWSTLKVTTPPQDIALNQWYNYDGTPTARHSYYRDDFIPSRNRIFLLGCTRGTGEQTPGHGYPDAFNVLTNTWDSAGSWNPSRTAFTHTPIYPVSSLLNDENCSCADPRTENIYISGYQQGQAEGQWWRFNAATLTWTLLKFDGAYNNHFFHACGTCIDIYRNKWVSLNWDNAASERAVQNGQPPYDAPKRIQTLDLASPYTLNAPRTITGAAAFGSQPWWDKNHALTHDTDRDKYIAMSSVNGRVYEIDPDTMVSTVIVGTNSNPLPINSVFRRFTYISALRACVYAPDINVNVKVLPFV